MKVCFLGLGYRSKFFIDNINKMDDTEIIGALVRDEKTIYEPLKSYNIFLTKDKEVITKLKPDFIINTASKKINYSLSKYFLEYGIPVLQETPIALNHDEIDSMVKYKGLYQIAEQYQFYDYFMNIKEMVNKGYLGKINNIIISYAHDYHAISIIRHLVGDFNKVNIIGRTFTENICHTKTRYDEFHDGAINKYISKQFLIDWDDIKIIYDFNSEEYRSSIRMPYIVIRGERGEIINDNINYLDEENNYINEKIDGYNSYDDNIPVKRVLLKMIDFVKNKNEFYKLEYAIDDSHLSIILNNIENNKLVEYKK